MKRYWLSTVPGSPVVNYSACGVDFRRIASRVYELTDAAASEIRADVGRHVVRSHPGGVFVLDIAGNGFQAQEGDRPLGESLYLVAIPDPVPMG